MKHSAALAALIDALRALPGPLPRDNARILTRIAGALDGGIVDRIRASRVPGLVRQSALETAIFRIFFVAGAWRRTG